MSAGNFDYKKILIIQTAFLGDVILTTPLVRALKEVFTQAKLDIVTIPETSIVFSENPYINDILYFDKRKLIRKIFSFINLVLRIRKNQYDLAISIQSSLTSAFLMTLGGIPVRQGFSRQKLLTLSVPHTRGLHKIQKILRLMEPFTDKKFNMQTELFWTSTEEEKVKNVINQYRMDHKHLIGIAPGSIWYTKRWIQEYYAELVHLLEKENIKIILIGGKSDQMLGDFIKNDSHATNLAGALTVLESAALIERLDLIVTNDSAPLHIANAVQTNVIAIFGPTARDFGFYPFRENDIVVEVDLECRPCSWHGGKKCPLNHHHCMKNITPDMVFSHVMKMLTGKSNDKSSI